MAQQADAITRRKRTAFLAAFAELGTITHAARAAGVERKSHYNWLKDPEYAVAFADAQEESIEALESEARRRAVVGNEKPVYQGGELVGTIREYSDTLLIFLMKAARPAVYRDRVDVTIDIRREIEKLTTDPAEREAALAEADRIIAAARA